MSTAATDLDDTGLEVIDLESDSLFSARRLHTRDASVQLQGMQRLASAFVDRPESILQELANAAVDLCGADSAGISLEQEDGTDAAFYQWVATAGDYGPFLHAILPRFPSACSVCLERGRAQIFRVSQRFFDLMGIEAPTVTDGILLPWQVGETRGTLWIMAHGRTEAFDRDDSRMMQMLADFAAMGYRQQQQQKLLLAQTRAAATAALANDLAHKINNPLQSMTNLVFLALDDAYSGDVRSLGAALSEHLKRLTVLTDRLLALPTPPR